MSTGQRRRLPAVGLLARRAATLDRAARLRHHAVRAVAQVVVSASGVLRASFR